MIDQLFQYFEEAIHDSDFDQAKLVLDLLQRLDTSHPVKLRLKLEQIRFNRLTKFTFEKTMTQELFEQIEQLNDPELTAKAVIELAYAPLFGGNLVKVEQICSDYEELIEETSSLRTKGFYYNILGNLATFQGKNEEALIYHQNSLKLRLEDGSKQLIAQSYSNLSGIYLKLNQEDKATKYSLKAVNITRELASNKSFNAYYHAHYLAGLFNIYYQTDRIEQAKAVADEIHTLYLHNKTLKFEVLDRLTEARLLQRRPKLLDKMKAKEIYAELAFMELSDVQQPTTASLEYSELSLLELEALGTEEAYQEVLRSVNRLKELAVYRRSLPIEIRANIMLAKLQLVKGRIEEGYALMEETKKLIEINDLRQDRELINQEMEKYEKAVTRFEVDFGGNRNFIDKIRDIHLRKYIEKAREIGFH